MYRCSHSVGLVRPLPRLSCLRQRSLSLGSSRGILGSDQRRCSSGTLPALSPGLGLAKAEIFAPGIPAAIAFGMGVVLGNVANILMFQALAATSNQDLVMALVNTSSVITFLGAFAGAVVAPRCGLTVTTCSALC